jgi:hypothetical protein
MPTRGQALSVNCPLCGEPAGDRRPASLGRQGPDRALRRRRTECKRVKSIGWREAGMPVL